MSYLLNGDRIILGTDYYPEHWDRSMWEKDLERMLKTGLEVIRVAEFSWNIFEPKEGTYTWNFFDEFLDLCAKKGMKVIFCTPTATPPAWMTDKYPEVLNARQDGVLYRHGARRHYNYNSAIYQKFTCDLVERMAEHYAKHPSIIGWQIDNEINCETNEFYSESDTLAFREYLKNHYGTIEELNKAWGTVFWNQTYTSWGEVYVPRTTLSNNTNPHEVLDYKRFVSDSACKWVQLQSNIIRKYIKSDDFITTNGLFGDLDNHRMTRESLNFMTYDSYPNMAYGLNSHFVDLNALKDRNWGMNLDEVRSLNGIFGIMEQQSGANGWNTGMESPTPRPGQITLWTMQSIAHGADYVGYFRWRTCTMGTEIYWHGILDYSSRDNRRLREIANIHGKIKNMAEVAGSHYEAEVGIIETYSNKFDAEVDRWHGDIESISRNGLYTASQMTHTPIDFVYLDDMCAENLTQYKVLFYPHAEIVTQQEAKLLRVFVEKGGTLVLGCRAGLKDVNGKCVQNPLPGLLIDLVGAEVVEYTMVAPDEGTVHADWDGTLISVDFFNDELEPSVDTKVLASYVDSYYKGMPALTEHVVGLGKVLYFGGTFNEETATIFMDKLGVLAPYDDLVVAPSSCEIAVRSKKSVRYIFVLNYSKEDQEIKLKREMKNLFSGEMISGTLQLKKYETLVLKVEK